MKLFAMIFFFTISSLQAQIEISGIVKDAATKNPLPFASITTSTGIATISDVDGKFSFRSILSNSSFQVSYIGFKTEEIAFSPNKKYYVISLSQKPSVLNAVLVGNANPALEIIKKAIQNKSQNDPQKKLKSFQFKSYKKIIVSAHPDSISGKIDSVFSFKKNKKRFVELDSSDYKFKKIVSKNHFYQSEKLSQFQYSNFKLKETILGTRMGGFKQPVYEVLSFNLQSFSIYDSNYELFETKHVSPISDQAFKKYDYKILDTLSIDGRRVYQIYFKLKHQKNTAGLEGLLYIDQNNYAIAKAIMRQKGVLDITGNHEFSYLEKENIWFPTANVFKIIKGKNNDDIKILGGTIQFDADSINLKPRKKEASDFMYFLSETTNSDFEYNIPILLKNTKFAVEVTDDAGNKPDVFWNTFRKDNFEGKMQRTYEILDSVSAKNSFEKRVRLGRKIINGYVPSGVFDFDLRNFLSYNNYEGFRMGLGGITNEKFSRKYRLDSYLVYGTKDGNFKYNFGGAARIGKVSNTWIGGGFTDDVREIASTSFVIDKRIFKLYDPRPINVSTFYNYQTWKGYIETKIIPKTESIWMLSQSKIEPQFAYTYTANGKSYTSYNLTTAMVSLQWNPFSDYMQTPVGRYETEKRFPKFTIQYTHSIPKLLGNDLEFGKIDFRADYEKKYPSGEKLDLLLEAGFGFGDIPLTHLYNTSPNNLTKNGILKRITIAGKNSFETMYFNEFFSSEYLFFQAKHGFKRIMIFKKIRPSLVLVTRMAWGNLEHPEQHAGIEYKTLNKGFFESGMELNQIYKGFGLTGFYRYGPNQLARFEDNLTIKLSFILNLGL